MNSSCKGPVTRENVSIWWRHHVSLCHHINKHNRRLFEKLLDQKYLRRPFQCFVIWHQNISFSYINTYKYHTQFCSIPVNQYIYFNSPSQYLNQCRFVENWSHRKNQWKWNRRTNTFVHEMHLKIDFVQDIRSFTHALNPMAKPRYSHNPHSLSSLCVICYWGISG